MCFSFIDELSDISWHYFTQKMVLCSKIAQKNVTRNVENLSIKKKCLLILTKCYSFGRLRAQLRSAVSVSFFQI